METQGEQPLLYMNNAGKGSRQIGPVTLGKGLALVLRGSEHGLESDVRLHEAVVTTFSRREQELPGADLPSMAVFRK